MTVELLAYATSSCRHHIFSFSLTMSLILHILCVSAGTPAPPSPPTSTAPLLARAALACGRGPHKGKVDGDLLLEELLAVGALDCSFRFVEGGVLN